MITFFKKADMVLSLLHGKKPRLQGFGILHR